MSAPEHPDWLTMREFRRLMRCGRSWSYIKAHELGAVRVSPKKLLVPRAAVERLLRGEPRAETPIDELVEAIDRAEEHAP